MTIRTIIPTLAGTALIALSLAAPAAAQPAPATGAAPAGQLAVPAAQTPAAPATDTTLTTGAPSTSVSTESNAAPSPNDALSRVPHLSGTVQGFDGATVFVVDDAGTTRHVTLHKGTIINPTGIRLREGMRVTVYGAADGTAFAATEIDTPYRTDARYGFVPAFGFAPAYGYGIGYGSRVYPAYGVGFGYRSFGGFGRYGSGARYR